MQSDIGWKKSISIAGEQFLAHYRGSQNEFFGITLSSIVFGLSSYWPRDGLQPELRLVAGGIFALSLIHSYYTGRPFGIDLTCTPTHHVDGDRKTDTMSERAGNILIQGDTGLVQGDVSLTRFVSDFSIKFDTSSEIRAELKAVPRSEHHYDPETNTLSCDNVSEKWFPYELEVYPATDIGKTGRYHSLKIREESTGKVLIDYQVIDVS